VKVVKIFVSVTLNVADYLVRHLVVWYKATLTYWTSTQEQNDQTELLKTQYTDSQCWHSVCINYRIRKDGAKCFLISRDNIHIITNPWTMVLHMNIVENITYWNTGTARVSCQMTNVTNSQEYW